MIRRSRLVLMAPLLACVSCGGGSSDTTPSPSDDVSISTGRFIDSAVQGLSYGTDTQSGVTDENGEFSYIEGETVRFSIGGLQFPSALARPVLSPLDMQPPSDTSGTVPTNIARLIQSLDADGDLSNGIVIPETAADIATPFDFEQSVQDFESDPDVINLVANAGSSRGTLVSAEDARTHLETSLTAEAGDAADLSDLAGYWFVEGSEDTIDITLEGRITFYNYIVPADCHAIVQGSVTPVEGPLFLVRTDDGMEQQLVITRVEDTLNILFVGTLRPLTDSDPSSLTICP